MLRRVAPAGKEVTEVTEISRVAKAEEEAGERLVSAVLFLTVAFFR
jgi:hypothetical protein